ncbi:MAG TPA: saccharopine dehydrogenase NADP-binding domain-containing protein [Herpetosiphonaceae bacterium]
MRIVVVGGAGLMGRIALRDLVEAPQVKEIVIADLNRQAGEQLIAEIGSSKLWVAAVDATDEGALAAVLRGTDVCLNASVYYFNLPIMRACLAARTHYLDLGGLFHTTRKQLELDAEFKAAGITAVLGMGSAPGVTNLQARLACDRLDTVEYIRIYDGIHNPQINPDDPLTWGYSIQTILDEVSKNPMVFRDGRWQEVAPLSELEYYPYRQPLGYVANHHSLHSEVATLPLSFRDKGVQEVFFKINFFGYPEAMLRKIAFLCELGFASTDPIPMRSGQVAPRDALLAVLDQRPAPPAREPAGYKDMAVEAKGTRDGQPVLVRVDVESWARPEWKASGGNLLTGVAPSIVAQWLADGTITQRGALPPEIAVPPRQFFEEARRRGIQTTIGETVPV